MSYNNQFPKDILYLIFKYLDAHNLAKCSLVCKEWDIVACSDNLWKNLCNILWKDKKNVRIGELFNGVDYSRMGHKLTVKELKSILSGRKVDYKKLIEKSELVQRVKETTPIKVPLIRGKWKSSYIISVLDSKRTKITKSELCSRDWLFKFKQWVDYYPLIQANFHEDYKYTSDLFEGEMNWRFYGDEIQVNQYPPTKTFRNEDWSWGIENNFVMYREASTVKK